MKVLVRNRERRERLTERHRSLITHYRPQSPASEQYRTMRTNLQFASLNEEIRLITVTSSSPGEGKSTTAANLAISLAQQGFSTLLIDGDMRKPTCHYTFGMDNQSGLTNVLINVHSLSDVLRKSFVPNLHILASGPIPPNPAELLSLIQMDWLLNELRKQFDYIIVDSPPVLAVADAQILAQRSDGVILVVSSGKTEKENGLKAKELLSRANTKLLGVVLNKKEKKGSHYQEYYARSK